MKIYARSLVAVSSVAIAIIALPVVAQNDADRRPQRSLQDDTSVFVNHKRVEQAKYIEALRVSGIPFGQIRSLVAQFSTRLNPNSLAVRAGAGNEINDAFLTDVALELATLGFGPADFRDKATATQLFEAAAAKRKGSPTTQQLVLLAQHVVTGTVVRYEVSDPQGLSGTFMRVRASRSLKGSIAEGELIDVALDTRRNSDGTFTRPTNEYLPKPGSEILVMLSTTASQVRGAAGAYGLAKFSKIAQPYDIVGNQAVPIASDSGALAL